MRLHTHTRAPCTPSSALQGDERDVILLSMVASPGSAPPQLGRVYEQRYNVALSRARDRMVLFRSLDAQHVSNPDDLKGWTIAFFAAAAGKSAAAASSAPLPAEAQLLAWLVARGYQVGVMCSLHRDRHGHGHGHARPTWTWAWLYIPICTHGTHAATLQPIPQPCNPGEHGVRGGG